MATNLDRAYGIIPPSSEYPGTWPQHFVITQGASGSISSAGWTADNSLAVSRAGASGNFGNEGFIQQTFLGASITDFSLNAGFGDTPSTMSINLVVDEYNNSDFTPLGMGDDPYHSGKGDGFLPPVVGTPVYFKFGKNPATIEQAFRQTYDDTYIKPSGDNDPGTFSVAKNPNVGNPWGFEFPVVGQYDVSKRGIQEDPDRPEEGVDFPDLQPYSYIDLVTGNVENRSLLWATGTDWRGRCHFNFGGILQSYTQNKGMGGMPVYSVNLTDPREILSNVDILLNNYQGTTFNNKNLINVYGFLEYDPSDELLQLLQGKSQKIGILKKHVDEDNGNATYFGAVSSWNSTDGWVTPKPYVRAEQSLSNPSNLLALINTGDKYYPLDEYTFPQFNNYFSTETLPPAFPITGQGFSRRSDKGMPWYRLYQGLKALFESEGQLPQEYVDAGFGGAINFRGFNYIVDFDGLPVNDIPPFYYVDFDKIDLLSLAQEICDITSHELFVSLLPIIDHPACKFLYEKNKWCVNNNRKDLFIAGIIRLEGINKTKQPKYGAIKSYLDALKDRGIDVESQDVGYELSNITTDKFVVGAQEVQTYYFSTERDRDDLWTWNQASNVGNMRWLQQKQWDLRTQEQQQVLPFYGMLGDNAVSIPRGFGAFQQILLDTRALNAYGVGNYYVATELELRAASVSYEKWKNFLLSYNDIYVEDISEHRAELAALGAQNEQIQGALNGFQASIDGVADETTKGIMQTIYDGLKRKEFAVTVPRCVWLSDRNYVTPSGYPASPCSPPFGYPLYYRRATSIGIVEAGIANIVNAKTRLVTNISELQSQYENTNAPLMQLGQPYASERVKDIEAKMQKIAEQNPTNYQSDARYRALAQQRSEHMKVSENFNNIAANISATENFLMLAESIKDGPLGKFLFNIEKTARKHEENARKVYDFVKKVADECLGKKFLVRIPKTCNTLFSQQVSTFTGDPWNVKTGPFGFPPRPITSTASDNINYDILKVGDLSQGLSTLFQASADAFQETDLWYDYLKDYQNDKDFSGPRVPAPYKNGALKGNFNPMSESWEWNYKPEPQGGFFGINVFGVNVSALQAFKLGVPWNKMPPVIRDGLCPIDMKNLTSDSDRVQCYVRYNHSENLDFSNVSPDEMTQQIMARGGLFIPDIVEDLPNNNIDARTRFEALGQSKEDQDKKIKQPDSMAFVKCSLDEKLYMPPKLLEYSAVKTFGAKVKMFPIVPKVQVKESKNADCSPRYDYDYPEINAVFYLPNDGGEGNDVPWVDFNRYYDKELDGFIIDTDQETLDDEHVYALVTVPGRVRSTIDTRWCDGPNQEHQALQLKHIMTQDTVQIPEFNEPAFPQPVKEPIKLLSNPRLHLFAVNDFAGVIADSKALGLGGKFSMIDPKKNEGLFGVTSETGPKLIPGSIDDWLSLSLEQVSAARALAKTVIRSTLFQDPQVVLGWTSPSPVFPDIFAIPLLSHERCYGPWLSATKLEESGALRYSDIGGKVEFIKDENLSPWSYAGYELMNDAGYLQAQFSNSLLLFSERGGFTFPDAPTGVSLAKALKAEGPLVTSISINVSQGGVKTTVKLDLYTAQWGKLAKQKEMAISQIARERQKLRDEQNAAIRRGLGKRATSADLVNTVMNAGGKQVLQIVNGVTNQIENNRNLGKTMAKPVAAFSPDQSTSFADVGDMNSLLGTMDGNTVNGQLQNTVIQEPTAHLTPVDPMPNDNMISMELSSQRAINLYTNSANHQPRA